MPKLHKTSPGESPDSASSHSSSDSTGESSSHASHGGSDSPPPQVPSPKPPEPTASSSPPTQAMPQPAQGGGGVLPLSLVGPAPASGGGFAATTPLPKPPKAPWSMGQSITTPTFPPTIVFQAQTSAAQGHSAAPLGNASTLPTMTTTSSTSQPGDDLSQGGASSASDSTSSASTQPSGDTSSPPSSHPPTNTASPDPSPPPPGQPAQPPESETFFSKLFNVFKPKPKPLQASPQDLHDFHALTEPLRQSELDYIEHLQSSDPGTFGSLSEDELLAIIRYTKFDYKPLNQALRDGTAKHNQWGGYARTLNAALSKLPKFRGVVIRGGTVPDEFLKQYRPGKIVSDPAFVSASAATDSPLEFHGEQEFFIQSKTGTYIEKISFFGHHGLDPSKPKTHPQMDKDRESEVLFAAGTRFRVTAREQGSTWDAKDNAWKSKDMIYLEEV